MKIKCLKEIIKLGPKVALTWSLDTNEVHEVTVMTNF